MTWLRYTGIWIAALLVSCEKPKDDGDPAARDSTSPMASRSSRARPEGPSGSSQRFAAALEKARQIEAVEERDAAIAKIVKDAVEINPALSAEAFRELSADSGLRPQLLHECSRLLVARSFDEALAWADLLGSSADVDAAKGTIAIMLAETDPLRAIEVVSGSGLPAGDSNGMLVQVLQTWSASTPQAAAAWALDVPSAESREVAIKAVASQWLMADSQAAFGWMAGINKPALRYEVTHALAQSLFETPEPIREQFLQNAESRVRDELVRQIDQIKSGVEQ